MIIAVVALLIVALVAVFLFVGGDRNDPASSVADAASSVAGATAGAVEGAAGAAR